MGIVIPRPAIRARESRAIHAKLAAHHRRTSFEVINLKDGESHGLYPTMGEAIGCVEFDGLTEFQVWRGDALLRCVEFA
jgi:hypothetical protein